MNPTLTMIEAGLAVLTVMGRSRSLSDRTVVERIYAEMESARLREQSADFLEKWNEPA